jgi:hypothetical protein
MLCKYGGYHFYGNKRSFHFFSHFIPYPPTIEKRKKSRLLPCGNNLLPRNFGGGVISGFEFYGINFITMIFTTIKIMRFYRLIP